MNVLCKVFGHKRNAGWWGDGLYGVLRGPTTDGTGREHYTVTLECDRCGERYLAARFHGSLAATPTPPTPICPCDPDNFANPDEHDISCVHAVPDSAPHLRREVLQEEITQEDRDQAASFIPTYAGWNGRMFADSVRSGKCDEHELVKAFAQHRLNSLAATPTLPTPSEDLREEIARIISPEAMKPIETMREEWTTWIANTNIGDGAHLVDKPTMTERLIQDEWDELEPKRLRALKKADAIVAALAQVKAS